MNITIIDNNAFQNCKKITNIYGCAGVQSLGTGESGKNVFYACTSLVEVEGLSEVKEICNSCFSGCTNLTTLSLDWAGLTNIGSNAFLNCSKLTNPNYIINGNTCTLGDDALKGSGLISHVI